MGNGTWGRGIRVSCSDSNHGVRLSFREERNLWRKKGDLVGLHANIEYDYHICPLSVLVPQKLD